VKEVNTKPLRHSDFLQERTSTPGADFQVASSVRGAEPRWTLRVVGLEVRDHPLQYVISN
jgi:hypothetical protein